MLKAVFIINVLLYEGRGDMLARVYRKGDWECCTEGSMDLWWL